MAEDSEVAVERRRARRRVRFGLPAHYVLTDQQEHLGTVIDASPTGLALMGTVRGDVGETVIVEVDGIGRCEGEVVRHLAGGFAIKFTRGVSTAVQAIAEIVERRLSDL
jgi:hypothetical protein